MRVQQQPAFVLHHRDYSETSLLLELLTRDYGRIGVIAKGARRARGGQRALLNPFSSLLLDWSGKGELGVLGKVEAGATPVVLAGESVYCGFYINELLIRLLHRHDPHASLFDTYAHCLGQLQGNRGNDRVLRLFEYRLLQELGYGLVLEYDSFDNTPVDPGAFYEYVPDSGPRRIHGPEGHSNGIRVQGRSLLALARGSLEDPGIMQELKQLMRSLLARHLGDRPLNSRRVMQSVFHRPRQGDSQA